MHGVMLEVDTEDKALLAEPDGYLTIVWPRIDSLTLPTGAERTREGIGWIALVALALLFGLLARFARRHRDQV